jgi:Tfp pilus assembly protein PilN
MTFNVFKRSTGVYIGTQVIDVVTVQSVFGKIFRVRGRQIEIQGIKREENEEERAYQERYQNQVVEALQQAIQNHVIKDQEVATSIPRKDSVLRYFRMVDVPAEERETAMRFEARKYLPFKLDDIEVNFKIFRYQDEDQMGVVCVAALRSAAETTLSLFERAGLKVFHLDIVPISNLRVFLEAKHIVKKGVFALLTRSSKYSAHVTVVVDGAPFLSRELVLSREVASVYDSVLGELSLTFDYFKRHYPAHEIEALVVSAQQGVLEWRERLSSDLPIPIVVGDLSIIGGGNLKNQSEAFGQALVGIRPRLLNLNILSSEVRASEEVGRIRRMIVQELAASMGILILIYMVTSAQVQLAKRPWEAIRKRIETFEKSTSEVAKLEQLRMDEIKRHKVYQTILDQEFYLTPKLSVFAQLLPDGFWIEKFTFNLEESIKNTAKRGYRSSKKRTDFSQNGLVINGAVYSEASKASIRQITQWIEQLKENQLFIEGFQEPKLDSVEQVMMGDLSIHRFKVSFRTDS